MENGQRKGSQVPKFSCVCDRNQVPIFGPNVIERVVAQLRVANEYRYHQNAEIPRNSTH